MWRKHLINSFSIQTNLLKFLQYIFGQNYTAERNQNGYVRGKHYNVDFIMPLSWKSFEFLGIIAHLHILKLTDFI